MNEPEHDMRPIEALFGPYHDGDLDDVERAALETALRTDPFARRDHMVYERTLEVLRGLEVRQAPCGLGDRLVARLGPELEARRARHAAARWRWLRGHAFELAAVLIVLLGVLVYAQEASGPQPTDFAALEPAPQVAGGARAEAAEELTFELPAGVEVAALDAQLREAGWAVEARRLPEGDSVLNVTLTTEGQGLEILLRQLHLWTGWTLDGEAIRAHMPLDNATFEVRLRSRRALR